MILQQRRKYPRNNVSLEAQVLVDRLLITGTVRDWSQGGAFFEPKVSIDGGKFLMGTKMLDKLAGVSSVQLTIFKDGFPLVLPAKIRWMGVSKRHGTRGIGLQDMTESMSQEVGLRAA